MKVRNQTTNQTIRTFLSAGVFMVLVVSLQADYFVSLSGSHTSPYNSWATAATNIQTAVSKATTGSTIWVADGAYSAIPGDTRIIAPGGKSLTFYGNPNAPERVIINGEGTKAGCYGTINTLGLSLNFNGFTFSNCYSTYHGGAISIDFAANTPISGNATIQNCIFVENQVLSGATGKLGGAVAFSGQQNCDFDLLFSNCVFSANSARSGGAVSASAIKNVTLVDCRATGNFANAAKSNISGGGAVWLSGCGAVNLRGCTFVSNRCDSSIGGGALYAHSSPSVLTDCNFEENEAIRGLYGDGLGGHGGAAFCRSSLFATNCVFRSNRANSSSSYGGAIYMNSDAPQTELYNCLIVGNLANNGVSVFAQAIFGGNTATGQYVIVNSTIVSNSAGVRVYGRTASPPAPTLEIYNSILCYNQSADITNNYTLIDEAGSTKLYDTATAPMPTDVFDGGGNITDDPKFVSFSGGDFHLQLGSPCIDAGLNQNWMIGAVDLDGRPRLDRFSLTVDMGCYELQKSGSVVLIH